MKFKLYLANRDIIVRNSRKNSTYYGVYFILKCGFSKITILNSTFKPQLNSLIEMKNLIVTGGNKGIGFAIANSILKRNLQYNIILTSRDKNAGMHVLNELRENFPDKQSNIDMGILDIKSMNSINDFKSWYTDKYGFADVIINNAGIAPLNEEPSHKNLQTSFATNFDGTVQFQQSMLDSVNNDGKIIFIASTLARKVIVEMDRAHSKKLLSKDLSLNKLQQLRNTVFSAYMNAESEDPSLLGWPAFSHSCYGLSKTFLISYAKVLGRTQDVLDKNIQVNSICPGYCKTSMTNYKGSRSPEEGAKDIISLVEKSSLVNESYQGQFFIKTRVKNLEKINF